ncbi:nucleotide-diphospho-sugar transferase [Paraphysoderma sedebokerense]|nr:nucleotide-diphospho-sugar transferase [Paraphysoderma sedebokerense]
MPAIASQAYVSLVTSDSYVIGALVLANSLRESGTTRQIVCLYTRNLSADSIQNLSHHFDAIIPVDPIRSVNHDNLALLGRPELDISFTKFHVWRLTQFTKVVFLDADTLILQNVDELFDREELSAAPDVGWPDCFNSGVFVCVPNEETYRQLVEFAFSHGSFDGGDQGILNDFFASWSQEPSRRLPFTFNVTPSTVYSYSPAYRRFKHDIKIVHFTGLNKPWKWSRFSNGEPVPKGNSSEDMLNLVSRWWQVYDKYSLKSTESSAGKNKPRGASGSYYNFGGFNPGVGGWSYSGPNPMEDFKNYRIEWPAEAYSSRMDYRFHHDHPHDDDDLEMAERFVKLKPKSPVTPAPSSPFSPGLPMNFSSSNESDRAHAAFEQKMQQRTVTLQPISPPKQNNYTATPVLHSAPSGKPSSPPTADGIPASMKTGNNFVQSIDHDMTPKTAQSALTEGSSIPAQKVATTVRPPKPQLSKK